MRHGCRMSCHQLIFLGLVAVVTFVSSSQDVHSRYQQRPVQRHQSYHNQYPSPTYYSYNNRHSSPSHPVHYNQRYHQSSYHPHSRYESDRGYTTPTFYRSDRNQGYDRTTQSPVYRHGKSTLAE